jgi:enamine deaminase RidA (YjgF/YER057c/UK114 family)
MSEMLADMEILKKQGFNLIKIQTHWIIDEPLEGQYDFSREDLDQAIQVVGVKGGPSGNVLIVTQLAGQIHTTPQDAHIVFAFATQVAMTVENARLADQTRLALIDLQNTLDVCNVPRNG